MPVVPDFAAPGVLPSGGISPVSPQAGLQADNALQGAGAKIQGGAQKLMGATMQLDQMQQQSAGLNANNQFMQKVAPLVSGPDGILAKQGQNAVDAYQPTVDQINQLKAQASQGLSPYAKQLFDQTTNYMMRSTLNTVGSHVAEQTIVAHQSSLLGTSSLAISTAAQHYNDPNQVQTALDTTAQAYGSIADQKGLTGPAKEAFILNGTSLANAKIIETAASTDPMYAETLLKRAQAAGQLDGATNVQLQHLVRSAVLPFASTNIASQVIGDPVNAPADGIYARMTMVESGDRQTGPDGQPITSDKGAVGIGQVMPQTAQETAARYNVPWDPQKFANDAAYNHHIGHLYFKQMQGMFPGQPAQAVAAYNAGPGAVQKAVAQYGGEWLAHLPDETQGYVSKVLGPSAGVPGLGAGMSPPQLMQNVQALESQASKLAETQFPDQPDAGPMAANRVFQMVMQKNEAYDHQQRATLMNVASVIDTNKIDSIDGLNKLGPTYMNQYNALSPQGQLSVQAMMKKNTPGADVKWTPKAQDTYNSLIGLSITDPAAFSKLNPTDPALVAVLPHSMISALSAKQAEIEKGAIGGIPPSRLHALVTDQGPNLISAGLNPHAKPGQTGYNSYQQFTGAFSTDVESFFDQHQRMPNTAETTAITNRLLVRGAVSGTGNWFTGPDTMPLFKAEGASDVPKFQPKIPPAVNAAINEAYTKQYGHAPDQATVAALYLSSLGPEQQQPTGTDAALRAVGTRPLTPPLPTTPPPGADNGLKPSAGQF